MIATFSALHILNSFFFFKVLIKPIKIYEDLFQPLLVISKSIKREAEILSVCNGDTKRVGLSRWPWRLSDDRLKRINSISWLCSDIKTKSNKLLPNCCWGRFSHPRIIMRKCGIWYLDTSTTFSQQHPCSQSQKVTISPLLPWQ